MNMIEQLIDAAKREDWEFIDNEILNVCDNSQVQEKALALLRDENGHIRDLGASIFEKTSHISLTRLSKVLPILREAMTREGDVYARYRSAFALAKHAPERYKQETLQIIKEAAKDPDVGKIAKGYLNRLK